MTDSHDDFDTESHEELMGRLQAADPTSVDSPPSAGSSRFTSIKDIAMSTGTNPTSRTNQDKPLVSAENHDGPGRFYGRSRVLALAAAAIAVVAGAAVVFSPGSASTAAAEVGDAVSNTVDVGDFRVTVVSDDLGFPGGQAEGEIDGENMYLVAGPLEFYKIGDIEWLGQDGVFQSMPATDSFAPFDVASEDVLTAALTSDDVETVGTETLNGVEATHYVIGIDDSARAALAQVPSASQYWFVGNVEEEITPDGDDEGARRFGFLEDANAIDVWVADGLIHQISVDSEQSQFTWTFRDFGENITITAPE